MKKIIALAIIFSLFAGAASAQIAKADGPRYRTERGFHDRELSRGERAKIHHNEHRYKKAKHKAYRNGKLSRHERKKLHQMRKHDRRQSMRYHHNDRRRV